MPEATMRVTGPQLTHWALLTVGFILAIIGMFTPWWTLRTAFRSGEQSFSNSEDVRPFSQGDFDALGNDLGTEVVITGILFLFALLLVVLALVLAGLQAAGQKIPPAVRHGTALFAAALAVAALLYAVIAWPIGNDATRENGLAFWDSHKDQTQFGPFSGTSTASTYAGVGWYLSLLGGVVLPVVGQMIDWRGDRRPAAAGDSAPPPVAAPIAPPTTEPSVARAQAAESPGAKKAASRALGRSKPKSD